MMFFGPLLLGHRSIKMKSKLYNDLDAEQVRFLQLKKSCSLGQASASFAKSRHASASAALKSRSITPCLDFKAKKLGIQLASEKVLQFQLLKTHCLFFFAFLGHWIPTAMSDGFF